MGRDGRRADPKRVRTPTVLQMESTECGAAALVSILAYFGRYVSLEEMRVECGVSRDGVTAVNLVKAARKYGLDAHAYKSKTETLSLYDFPMILFWNFGHFVVYEGRKRRWHYLNDPASGPRKVSDEDFDRSFTGVVLTFQPGPTFQEGGQKPSLVRALRKRFEGSWSALNFAVLAGLFLVIPGIAIPVFSRVFVDDVLVKRLHGWLRPLIVAMVVTALLRAALRWLQANYLLRMRLKLALTGSSDFMLHVLRMPLAFFWQRTVGDINARVGLNQRLAHLLSGRLATTIIGMFTVVFYAVVMFNYSYVLTLIGIFFSSLNMAALRYVSRKRTDLNCQMQQEIGRMMGVTMAGLQRMETLKATGSESDFFARWAGHQTSITDAEQTLSVWSQLLDLVPRLLTFLSHVAILVFGSLLVTDGKMTLGMLVAFQSLMASFMAPFKQMVNMGALLQDAQADVNRLEDVLRHPVDRTFSGERSQQEKALEEFPPKLSGGVELKGITFGYSPLDPPLIESLDLDLRPGARVAIVGGTGSGKTTVAKLAAGLYEPWSGQILLDGVPADSVPRPVITNSIAMVDQEIFLFEGTIRDNITMWDGTLPESDIVRGARDACIHEDIAARSGGYGGHMEEGGRNLSGGQRQRIEIARALAKSPTVLILDEATSALDPTTEKRVDDNIRRRGCTCIIVAHRLSTIRDADEIIVMDRGKVVERGSHHQLMEQEGFYANLIRT